jgi:hypothetical protein
LVVTMEKAVIVRVVDPGTVQQIVGATDGEDLKSAHEKK